MRSIEKQTQTIIFRNKELENQFERYQFFIDHLLSIDNYTHIPKKSHNYNKSKFESLINTYVSPLQIWDMEKQSLIYKLRLLGERISEQEMIDLLKELVELIEHRKKYQYSPYRYHNDNIISFIICKKINVVNKRGLLKKIEQAYLDEGIDILHRHNIILSIEDGLLLYYDPHTTPLSFNDINWAFPHLGIDKLEQRFIPIQEKDKEYHFKQFAHHLYNGVADTTILHPESAEYFNWEGEGENINDVINFNSTGMKPIKKRSKVAKKPRRNQSNSKRKKKGIKSSLK